MASPRDLKVQMAGETRARERAQALAATQAARAARAETALREALAELDIWKTRALAAEAGPPARPTLPARDDSGVERP